MAASCCAVAARSKPWCSCFPPCWLNSSKGLLLFLAKSLSSPFSGGGSLYLVRVRVRVRVRVGVRV